MTKEIQASGTTFTVYADGPKRGVTIAPVNRLQFAKVMGQEEPPLAEATRTKTFDSHEYYGFTYRLPKGCKPASDPPMKRVVRKVEERVAVNYDGSYRGFMQAEYYDPRGAVDDVVYKEETTYEIMDGFTLKLKFDLD